MAFYGYESYLTTVVIFLFAKLYKMNFKGFFFYVCSHV
jgi:hypothetical protein